MLTLNDPLLSVIIPTYNRPEYLRRAVDSALESSIDNLIEVIVVPNGGDLSWKTSLKDLLSDKRLVISEVKDANANIARNHGLQISKGRYVRFLDDDDFLYPLNCQQQLKDIIKKDSDLSVAGFDILDSDKNIIDTHSINITYSDFHSFIFSHDRTTHVCSYLFKKEFLKNVTWDECCKIGQDVHFVFEIISQRMKIDYIFCNYCTGAWVQHMSLRISTTFNINNHYKTSFEAILKAIQSIDYKNHLFNKRLEIAIECMWDYCHKGFVHNPVYWSKSILKIRSLKKDSWPNDKIYIKLKYIHPLILEWFFYPYRFFKHPLLNLFKVKAKKSFWE